MNKKKELVAVYGSLKRGFGNSHRLLHAKLLGTTKTEPKYTMRSLRAFPGVTLVGNTPITVEVYEIDDEIKRSLDALEGHRGKGHPSNFYDVTEVDTEFGKATMYVLDDKEYSHCPVVEDGIWK